MACEGEVKQRHIAGLKNAWEKAFQALSSSQNGGESVAQWLIQDVGSPLEDWVQMTDPLDRLATLRGCVGDWPNVRRTRLSGQSVDELAQVESLLVHLLILLGAEASAQLPRHTKAVETLDAFVCPAGENSAEWIDQHEVPIAVAAHLFLGQGLAVSKHGSLWRVSNMLRSTTLGAIDATERGATNPNVKRIAIELEARKRRLTGEGLTSADGAATVRVETNQFRKRQGASLFVLDDARTFTDGVQELASLGLPVVEMASEDQDSSNMKGFIERIQEDLVALDDMKISEANPQLSKETAMEKPQSPPTVINVSGARDVAINSGSGTQNFQITNTEQKPSLTDLIAALQQLQSLLPSDHPQRDTITDVIEIAQNEEEGQSSAQRKIKGFLPWLKAVAEGAESVEKIVDKSGKVIAGVQEKAAAAIALAAPYWQQIVAAIQ
jgi:hypothetical protein